MGKISILDLKRMKEEGEKITMLTAYDCQMARLIDSCGVDVILVGDSVGNVMLGYKNTLPVTTDEIIHHTKAVSSCVENALVVADMPFGSYQVSKEEAKQNAIRMIKEGGAEAVKVEGGENMRDVIEAITSIDIPVMAHIGLTPQSIHKLGGYRVQGRDPRQREKLINDALAVEKAGAFAVVLEVMPSSLAKEITASLEIPTIGIGAGPFCDGQVLVISDLLGMDEKFKPKFVKRYARLSKVIRDAVGSFVKEVKEGIFPSQEETFE